MTNSMILMHHSLNHRVVTAMFGLMEIIMKFVERQIKNTVEPHYKEVGYNKTLL